MILPLVDLSVDDLDDPSVGSSTVDDISVDNLDDQSVDETYELSVDRVSVDHLSDLSDTRTFTLAYSYFQPVCLPNMCALPWRRQNRAATSETGEAPHLPV